MNTVTTTHKPKSKGLTLTPVCDGLKKGIKSDGTSYSVRDDRSRFFYPDEWVKFYNRLRDSKKPLYDTLLQTGGRIEEILNLKPKDLDHTRNTLILRVTKVKVKKGERMGKTRTMPVSTQYLRRMRAHISERGLKSEDFLFKVSKQGAWQTLRRNIQNAGIKDYWNFGLHNIRKTTGNWMKALGVPAEEVCLRLGHDFNTYLKHYGSPNIFDRKDKVEMIKIMGDMYDFK